MDAKETLYHLRTQKGLSQAELAEKIFVTRQAVSRWETGDTTPNTETLKLLSALFGVSINTLLGCALALAVENIHRGTVRRKTGRIHGKALPYGRA